MNTEKYTVNLIIDDNENIHNHFFDNVSIWDEIKRFVPIFIKTALELNSYNLNIYFNNLISVENVKTNNISEIIEAMNTPLLFYYNLHETISIVFNKIQKSADNQYIVLITDNIDKIDKLFENRNYVHKLKYIRILLFSTKKNIKTNDQTIKIFYRNYILSDKTQTIFTLTS